MVAHGPVPDIWLITGLPGAGKSTVARGLSARLERAAHLDGEALWHQIIAGRAEPDPDSAPGIEGESERQYELTIRNQCLLARSYAEAGFVPLLEFVVVTGHHLDAYRHYLMGGRLHLVVVAPPLERLSPDGAQKGIEQLDATLRVALANTGLWLDTSDLDVEATVDAVLERQDEALLG